MTKALIPPDSKIPLTVDQQAHGKRIDVFLNQMFPTYSRTFFQALIEQRRITINNILVDKPSLRVKQDDIIIVHFPPETQYYAHKERPASIKVDVIFEHPDFLIINKPANLMVHVPSRSSTQYTLVDWLLSHFQEIRQVGMEDRPGIVHRLDKDTSGLIIVPRNNYAHNIFNTMFKNREIHKTYLALVQGHPPAEGTITLPIARDPSNPTRMTYKNIHGRPAITHFKTLKYFHNAALLELKPITGRTHQLRVHCAAIGHPILGDITYGNKSKLIDRQALHATCLQFVYEQTPYTFCTQPPEDFQRAQELLAQQSLA